MAQIKKRVSKKVKIENTTNNELKKHIKRLDLSVVILVFTVIILFSSVTFQLNDVIDRENELLRVILNLK